MLSLTEYSYVKVRACGCCHQRHIELRKTLDGKLRSYCVRCENFTRVVFVRPEGGHFVETRNHKRGKLPAAVDFGMSISEFKAAQARVWVEFAVNTAPQSEERMAELRAQVRDNIYSSLDLTVVDAAIKFLVRKRGIDADKAHNLLKLICAQCGELLRQNAGRRACIDMRFFMQALSLNPGQVYPQRAHYQPMARLFDEIEGIVASWG